MGWDGMGWLAPKIGAGSGRILDWPTAQPPTHVRGNFIWAPKYYYYTLSTRYVHTEYSTLNYVFLLAWATDACNQVN